MIALLWHDLRAGVGTLDGLAEFDSAWDAPLDLDGERAAEDEEALQQLVDSGQALDLEDAKDWMEFQMANLEVTDPTQRAANAAQFAARRRERMAARSADVD